MVALCSHINTRIKSNAILLPVAALLDQFKDPAAGGAHPLIQNFDLMYITTTIDRMPVAERLLLLPKLATDLSRHPNDHQQRMLFHTLLRLLLHFVPPPRGSEDDTALREQLFGDRQDDAEWIAAWVAKLMLLNLSSNLFGPEDSDRSSPGLSSADIDFLTLGRKKERFAPATLLVETKVAALNFLASGAFCDRDRYRAALIASTDTNSLVVDPAQDLFKRSIATISLEDGSVVAELYSLLLGQPPAVPPAKLILQAKILGLLSKSCKATEAPRKPEIEAILKLGLETTYARLRQAAFSFVAWVSRMAEPELVDSLAPGAVESLRYWLLSDQAAAATDDLRGYAYEALALLASRCTHLVLEPNLGIVRFLFRQLRDDRGGVAVTIEGALGAILTKIAREPLSGLTKAAMEDLLLGVVVEEKRGAAQAVKWAGRLLSFGCPVGRWIGVLAVGMGGSVAEEGAKGACLLSCPVLSCVLRLCVSIDLLCPS